MAPDFSESIEHPVLRGMHAYWCDRIPDGRLLPGRQHIDPIDFPGVLSRMALIDVLRGGDGLHFRYRLTGTEIVARAGRDPTGKRFDELYSGDYLVQALKTYADLTAVPTPHYSRRVYPLLDGREHLEYARLILPLARDGRVVDMFWLITADLLRVERGPYAELSRTR
ncbi:PAS domain-containing protein [Marivibrio halodurans]|uniref:PAS domain-containing protein n=1 Tax=Marivibrio halodurans TaxID=2039722 RepID=A0A8J7SML2_9PROT|nr:PAS domain-containing protein [Marivibrio halodurans]MBP5857031.1 PAS domain-containing protein [Marivibrio halodurans]